MGGKLLLKTFGMKFLFHFSSPFYHLLCWDKGLIHELAFSILTSSLPLKSVVPVSLAFKNFFGHKMITKTRKRYVLWCSCCSCLCCEICLLIEVGLKMHLACFVSFMTFHFFLNLDFNANICPIRTLILISFIFFKKIRQAASTDGTFSKQSLAT